MAEFSAPLNEQINELHKELGEQTSEAIKGFLSDDSLSRFLRARNWNVPKASKMLKAAVKWRLVFKPETICWVCLMQLVCLYSTKSAFVYWPHIELFFETVISRDVCRL
jgi:hypothetical protein